MGGTGVEQLLGGGGVGQAHLQALADCRARLRSFWCSSIRKPGSKVRVDHPLAVDLKNSGTGEPAHQRLAHLRRIGAGLGGEQQRLGHRLDGERHDDLVGNLGGLTVAVAADQRDVLAHQLEQRLDLLERRFGPPTMIESVAFRAPTSPPETGASS